MKISLNWLRDYVEFDKKLSVKDIAWRLTEATAEVEKIHDIGKGLENVVVGELTKFEKHPNADNLFVGHVKISPKESIQVIFGQKAVMQVGDKVPTAIAPCELPGGKIERRELRGVLSEGMLCLDNELVKGAAENLTRFDKSTKVGTPVTALLHLDDVVLEVDNHSITHRPDLFSHLGFARECVALGIAKWKRKEKMKDYKKMTGKKKAPLKVEFKTKEISKNYYGTVISNLSTKASPAWMRARLAAVGIRSINAIVDVTNYVMMDIGQPNHAFDLRILEGKTFINRLSKKGEKIMTLDGVSRELPEGIIVGETEQGIVDLAGIMGAQNSEIKSDTKTIYFHSSQFNNVMIRRAMIALGHRTDGGTMYEKNIEAERSELGFVRGLELFAQIFPEATFDYETIHIQHERSPKRSIRVPLEKIKTHLGIDIPPQKSKQYLASLGFAVKMTKKEITAEVPNWRISNVSIPEDIVEEVARINGYSNVPATPPMVELVTPHRVQKRHMKRVIQHFLVGQGYQEEVNFSFLSESLLEKAKQSEAVSLIEIKNPVSDDFRFMRPSQLAYLLSNLERNQLLTQESKTFEMGAVYERNDDEVLEQQRLTIVNSVAAGESFSASKGVMESLLRELAIQYHIKSSENASAYPGRCISVTAGNEVIAEIYELHPELKQNFGLRGSVAVIEVHLDALYRLSSEEVLYRPLNRNPEALLDINVLVDEHRPMIEVQNIIRSVEPGYLKKADLIDIYRSENLGKEKKSLTFALTYQHPERTLDEKEIQSILEALIKKIEANGGVVRR